MFNSFASFLDAVIRADTGEGRHPDLSFAAASGLHEGVGVDGGFLVPDELAATLWERVYATGELLALCARQPVSRNKLSVPAIAEASRADGARFGGVVMSWASEAQPGTASRPKLRSINLGLKKLIGLAYATDELLQDVPALAAILERAFGLEAAYEIEAGIVAGSGIGRPLGILTSSAAIEVTRSGSGFAGADVVGMWRRSWAPSRRRAVWLVNPESDVDLLAAVATATLVGSPAVVDGVPLLSWGADGEARVLGRPVMPHEACAAPGARGDLVLADPSQYLVAEREPEVISSIHVRFLQGEGVFRFRWRVDGAPAWATPVTPRNSGSSPPATVSPFVVLGAAP